MIKLQYVLKINFISVFVLDMCSSSIINTPQYVIVGYEDRIEIYSCFWDKF